MRWCFFCRFCSIFICRAEQESENIYFWCIKWMNRGSIESSFVSFLFLVLYKALAYHISYHTTTRMSCVKLIVCFVQPLHGQDLTRQHFLFLSYSNIVFLKKNLLWMLVEIPFSHIGDLFAPPSGYPAKNRHPLYLIWFSFHRWLNMPKKCISFEIEKRKFQN